MSQRDTEVERVAKEINNGLASMLTPSSEAMRACRWVKSEVEQALKDARAEGAREERERIRKKIWASLECDGSISKL